MFTLQFMSLLLTFLMVVNIIKEVSDDQNETETSAQYLGLAIKFASYVSMTKPSLLVCIEINLWNISFLLLQNVHLLHNYVRKIRQSTLVDIIKDRRQKWSILI